MSGEEYTLVLPNREAYVARFASPPMIGDLTTGPDGPWRIHRVVRLPNAPRPVVFVARAGHTTDTNEISPQEQRGNSAD